MSLLILAIIVVLALPGRNKDLIAFAKVVLQKMTNNANFPNPTPPLGDIDAAISSFESAETSMKTSKMVIGDRAKKRRALITLLNDLRHYVQTVCQADADNAAAIAESAGMRLKIFTKHVKAAFAVVQGHVSGSVVCSVKASGMPTTYYFSYSLDQKNWTAAPDVMISKITISGLTPGQTYSFRFRTLDRKGLSDFSQIVTFMVT